MVLFKKFFKRIQQFKWNIILLELFIVFVGVYLAFLLNNYQENQRIGREADKIYTSLKVELERIRIDFPGQAAYQRSVNMEWDSLWENEIYGSFYEWRYIQPQYDFTTLEYALRAQESSIVDFELYESLTKLYRHVKQLEHIELLITDLGLRYRNVPADSRMNEDELATRHADNRMSFYKFRDLAQLRAGALDRMAGLAESGLAIINAKLGNKKRKQIEKRLLAEHLHRLVPQRDIPAEAIVQEVVKLFPALTPKEAHELVAEFKAQ